MNLQQLLSPFRKAIEDYNMINDGDKIAVGLSGGKDSIALLSAFCGLKRFYPKKFELVAVTIDTGVNYDKTEFDALKDFVNSLGVEYHIEKTEIYDIVFKERKETNPCSLCANMRRGALNQVSVSLGCNKVALGHHADDLVETFYLSMLYEGRLSTFSPVTHLERANLDVIRPMIYVRERDIISFTSDKPILHNPCPADKNTRREYIKNLLKDIRKEIPFSTDNVLNALIHPERTNLFTKPTDKK